MLDHVLLAPGQRDQAERPAPGEVAGTQPAVGRQRPARRLVVAVVAPQHPRALHDELADLPHRDLGALVVDRLERVARHRDERQVEARG